MLRQKLQTLVLLLVFLITSNGCGKLGFNKDVDNDDSLKEVQDIQVAYKAIEGVYIGEITVIDDGKPSALPIEVSLFSEIDFGGGRANGELTPQTTLLAIFKILAVNSESNYLVYSGRYYYRKDGRIQLAVGDGKWFQAWIEGNKIVNGTLYDDGQVGTFKAERSSGTVQVPAKGRLERDRKRFARIYQDAIGTYRGFIIPPGVDISCPNDNPPVGLQRLEFQFYPSRGLLKGRVSGEGASEGIRLFRVSTYRTDSGFLEIEGLPGSGGTRNPAKGFGEMYGVGTLMNGALRFEHLEDHKGLLGSFCAKKI